MKLFLLTIGVISQFWCAAQITTIALVQPDFDAKFKISREIEAEVAKTMLKEHRINHMVYTYEQDKLTFYPEMSSDSVESAAEYMITYFFNIYEDYHPPVYNAKDNSGKAFFQLTSDVVVRARAINIQTNLIEKVAVDYHRETVPLGQPEYQTYNQSHFLPISNPKKTFDGVGPAVLEKTKPKRYKAILEKLWSEKRAEFEKYYRTKASFVVGMVRRCEVQLFVPDLLMATHAEIDKGKAKKITVVGDQEMIVNNGLLTVFSLDTIKGYVLPELYGDYQIESSEGNTLTLDAFYSSKAKKAGECYESGKQLYASFSQAGYTDQIDDDGETYVIGLNLGANYTGRLEPNLTRISKIKLVDFETRPIIEAFREHYKSEKFIDNAFELRATGSEYQLQINGRSMQLVSTETGEILGTYDVKEGFDGMYDTMMDVFDMEVEVVNEVDKDEKKIKSLTLFSPLGFKGTTKFIIYRIEKESVNGKTLERAVEIGECKTWSQATEYVAEFKVKDGDKEIQQALIDGKDLRFRNKPGGLFKSLY